VQTGLRHLVKQTILLLLYHMPPFPQKLNGRTFWVHPRSRFSISTETFFRREPHVRRWLRQLLQPGHVFFDVGAHHGWVSMWGLTCVGVDGAVYSFEPSPTNLRVLQWNRNANGCPHWKIIPRAVSDEDVMGRRFFLVDAGDSPMNSLTSGAPGMPLMEGRNVVQTSVHTVTLDTFCRDVGVSPNVVKIDVEGAELLVLRGARQLLIGSQPAIILAVHPYWLPAGQSPVEIVELLRTHGYTMFNSEGNEVECLHSGEYLCLGARHAHSSCDKFLSDRHEVAV
jgi:FkbM family methyltransferase